jgi:hypothetical protein
MNGFSAPSPAASCGSSLGGVAAEDGCWDWDSLSTLEDGALLWVGSEEASLVVFESEGVEAAEELVQELVRHDWGRVWVM